MWFKNGGVRKFLWKSGHIFYVLHVYDEEINLIINTVQTTSISGKHFYGWNYFHNIPF